MRGDLNKQGAPIDGAHSVTVDAPAVKKQRRLTHRQIRRMSKTLISVGVTLQDMEDFAKGDSSGINAKLEAAIRRLEEELASRGVIVPSHIEQPK